MTTDDLLLIAVGGAASGIAVRIAEMSNVSMRTLILDTDDTTLQKITPRQGLSTWIFGVKRINGRGTGGDRYLAASALRDDASALQAQIGSPKFAIVLTCCGGGTSGAVPQLLALLRSQGITTMTFATTPFAFEGNDRLRNAQVLVSQLEPETDAFARIPLDSLITAATREQPIECVFDTIAQRLAMGMTLFWTLLVHPAFIAFDADHFRQFLENNQLSGVPFFFADATAEGMERANFVVQECIQSPRLRDGNIDRLASASKVVVGVLAGDDLRLNELTMIMDAIHAHTPNAEIMLGTSFEILRENTLSLVVMAFGLPQSTEAPRGGKNTGITLPASPKPKPKGNVQATGLGSTHNPFAAVEPTIINGQNLDTPTYLRRGIRLGR